MRQAKTIDVWVAPTGSDQSPGTWAKPVATPGKALRLLRQKRRAAKTPTVGRVLLRGGTYTLRRPLAIGPLDSGSQTLDQKGRGGEPARPTLVMSAPGERATLSGGRPITGWKPTTVHGQPAWVASLPAVRRGTWNFTQLWVNGQRAQRPRLPGTGVFRIAKRFASTAGAGLKTQSGAFTPEDRFGFRKAELHAFHNLTDVDFVALHFWIESRIPLKAVDVQKRVAELAFPTRMRLTDNHTNVPAPYYLDNVFEALHKPGQWYLDRPAGKLYYLPRPGEKIETAQAIAPVLDHVVSIEGNAHRPRHAQHIELHDLTIAHCEFAPAGEDRQATAQAAAQIPGAVRLRHAHRCALRRCTVEHVGSYGIAITGDSTHCAVDRCTVHDTSAGGVKVFHENRDPHATGYARNRGPGPWFHPRHIAVTDCHLYDGGHRWRQAVGVLVGNCSGVHVLHNHVHDYDYTGVSVGWTWGYKESNTYGNTIEWNHIHDIGRGALSDMGGIYTLGKQPGTRIRFNHIHDVDSRGYGGWGIYPDEGSADMLIACNLVHDTKCDTFSQHYGRDNVVENNIFAFARSNAMIGLGRREPHTAYTIRRNIIVTDGVPITRKPYNADDPGPVVHYDHNLYFDVAGRRLTFNGRSLSSWRKTGQDRHSLIADPGFRNAAKRDFRLKANSPALALGFIPFDLSNAGPRPA